MAERSSNYFVANLGPASGELEERIKQWAAGSCAEHRVSRDGDSLRLLASRKQPTTTRNLRNLLRTLAKTRWGTPLGELPASWLQPLSQQEFRVALGDGGVGARPPRPSPKPPSEPRRIRSLEERREPRWEMEPSRSAISWD